jgi:undecaprenyl-diphosphatase
MLEIIQQIDKQLFFAINNGMQNGLLDLLCPFMRKQSNWYLLYAVMGYFLYERYRMKFFWILLGALLLVLISDQLSANLIKNIVQRLRPCNNPELKNQLRLLVPCGGGFSFISAHATNHFAIAFFISSFYNEIKWAKLLALLWAFAIAFSQVYVGVHYPFDVICGAALGLLLGNVGFLILNKNISFTIHKAA